MELEPNQAASSSSHTHAASSPSNTLSTERTLRSGTRAKATKDKERETSTADIPAADGRATRSRTIAASSSSQKRPRDSNISTGKGKAKEVVADQIPARSSKRTRRNIQPASSSTALTINEPIRDPKGKKRALPETTSDEEASIQPSKRSTSYSLRSRKDTSSQMPKKNKTPTKGKSASTKGKVASAASGPSRLEDDEMMPMDYEVEVREENDDGHQDDCDDDLDEEMSTEARKEETHEENANGFVAAAAAAAVRHTGEEPSAMMSMFSDFGRIGNYLGQINGRLRTLLTNIKLQADPTTRLIALQELSELLSISTEDTLAGSFQVESFVRELVRILGGNGGQAAQDEADGDDDDDGNEDDAALAAALAMSGGPALQGDQNLEAQLLACRCLANLMEALPGCGHTLVYHGAIPVLCSKLVEISYIDLAEQTLITLEKISEEYPSAIVREGGLAALLNYLDFFSIALQRTALQAASNCCKNASVDSFPMIKDVWPIIRNCLGYSDQRLVDYASLCIVRVVESYSRSHADKLDELMDTDLIRAVNMLLLPAGSSPLVPPSTYTLLLKGLATAARASPKITLGLLKADIVTTLYQILAGVLPPADGDHSEQGDAEGGQGLGGGLADMVVMENLAHRPKEQIEEALTLVSELLPPLPKDGTFDHRGYSEKALHRMIKAKAKADKTARITNPTLQLAPPINESSTPSRAATPIIGDDDAPTPAAQDQPLEAMDIPILAKDVVVVDRTELLRSDGKFVVHRFIQLLIPVLVDVYAASVSIPVRLKALTGILKAICFLDGDSIKLTFKFVPIASFASSILSSKDHPSLVIGGLQMVELLLSKLATEYEPSFRREGVLHEIETLAARTLTVKAKEKDKDKEQADGVNAPEQSELPVPSPVTLASGLSKKLHVVDAEDAYTLRARVIRFKYLSNDNQSGADLMFVNLRRLNALLRQEDASEDVYRSVLCELADLFASPTSSVSSFELLQSGLVDGLVDFAMSKKRSMDLSLRERLLSEELFPCRNKGLNQPIAALVKKLQESLTRMESFEVITVTPGAEGEVVSHGSQKAYLEASKDSKRSSPSLLARQIRLRLVAAEGSDTPRQCNNIVVSIHAIATFQALNDYLRPRLSGLLSSVSGPRLSGVLAAFAAGRIAGPFLRNPTDTQASAEADSSSAQLTTNGASSSSAAPTEDSVPQRRRSQRLSAKASAINNAEQTRANGESSSTKDPQTSALSSDMPPLESMTEVAASETAVNDDEDNPDDFMDADVDAEVLEEEVENDDSMAEKTITLSVADDGSKVEAQTPDGTRITTPNASASVPSLGMSSTSPPKASYAAALQKKPTDWHLEFCMDDNTLPLDMTVYGAVHQHEVRKSSGSVVPLNLVWQGVYTIKYKKVSGPPTAQPRPDPIDSRSKSPSLSSLPEDAAHSKILRLLRVLHKVNSQADNHNKLPETAFINNKLTAKLTRQLEEPMIVASSCLPDWAVDLPVHFPFLFPFNTRFAFLQSTSFGYARLILKWQSQQSRTQDHSRRDDSFGFLGRLQRQKVRISRKHVLESAFKVFELYGSSSSILEVEYFDEVGTGLGPTLEFYSLVSKEFARRDLKIWRDADTTYPGAYVSHPTGLFPAPLDPTDTGKEAVLKVTHVFRIIGQFVAKAMLDSRIIDISLNKLLLQMILGESVPLTIDNLQTVDPGLARSLTDLHAYTAEKDGDDSSMSIPKMDIEELALDFTVPGYDIELRPDGKDIQVTRANVKEYIEEVLDAVIGKGVALQAKAFREGFSKVFPVTDLRTFSADELAVLFGSGEEDWSVETLGEVLKADHGFNVESRTIRDLVSVMSQYDPITRRDFLQFITGSPKLPIGGFRGLNPSLTVVRKPHEAPLSADDYLPSVMTCVNYLKLPEYSSKDVMREKLKIAMKEGVGSFHLS